MYSFMFSQVCDGLRSGREVCKTSKQLQRVEASHKLLGSQPRDFESISCIKVGLAELGRGLSLLDIQHQCFKNKWINTFLILKVEPQFITWHNWNFKFSLDSDVKLLILRLWIIIWYHYDSWLYDYDYDYDDYDFD